VISLVALCNPSLYNTVPLSVIEANFVRPYELASMCAALGKWLIHFSTSEVYGRTVAGYGAGYSGDTSLYVLSEDRSPMLLGPVHAQRWSYACAKQLLERAIYAFAFEKGLAFTILRPFNFIGPRMDYIPGIDGEGVPRVLACFMDALLFHKPLQLVNGGLSRRCFTYIDDAIDAVIAVLERPGAAKGQIFNIGNPRNEISMADLAHTMIRIYKEIRPEVASCEFETKSVRAEDFYGEGYEDSDRRMPDIGKARELLGWEPRIGLDRMFKLTVASYIEHYASRRGSEAA
jgi:UDP-apiose/xylose synthase